MKLLISQYGMGLVLLLLCVLFSAVTITEQTNSGRAAALELVSRAPADGTTLIVGATNTDSADLAGIVDAELKTDHRLVIGTPRDLRLALDQLISDGKTLSAVATAGTPLTWPVLQNIATSHPTFADFEILSPQTKTWPTFLKKSNLIAVVDRIVVIAVIAIGMTLVIITGGIDLSVGSLIALAAVISTLIVKHLGGLEASGGAVALGFVAAILACGLVGAATGSIVAHFGVASFIVTLGVMMIARGEAFTLTGGFSIYQVPDSLTWLGQGKILGVPNTVIVLIILYVISHIFMTRTRMGRYIYAVGGNREAARLSGVPVRWVTTFVFIVSGLMAGIGGCIQASQVKTGTPNMGEMYELYVIAAVVVGGTSLSGGSGRIFGTLIGAFIIAVIQNGMNLLGLDSYKQMIVLGGVIVIAVLLDQTRRHGGFRQLLAAHE